MIILESRVRPDYWGRAVEQLGRSDRRLSGVIDRYGGDGEILCSRGDPFVTLARSIVGQQISVMAAEAIWRRLVAAVGEPVPERVLAAGGPVLREAGLSGRKADYLLGLAAHFSRGEWVSDFLGSGDEQVIETLVKLPGIGRWTAEMFLIFGLLRPNVLPVDDIGLLRAMSNLYHDGHPVTREEALSLGRRWHPWRTVATWFMWRSLDPLPVHY